MQKNQYEFEVLVNGKPVNEYDHKGKTFIEGKEGTEFAIRMRNHTGKRALFVPTIDGLSVMDGKEASYESSGYIVGAYSSETIEGWRTSDSEIAKFFFSKVKESYAAATGKDGNVGVIGCAVIREKEKPQPIVIKEYIREKEYIPYPVPQYPRWPHDHIYLCQAGGNQMMGSSVSLSVSNSAGSAQAMNVQTSASLGTGFGEVKYSPVRTVEFEREEVPVAVFTIEYNTRANLEAMGVEFKKAEYANGEG